MGDSIPNDYQRGHRKTQGSKNPTHKNGKKDDSYRNIGSHSSRWTDRPFDFVSRSDPSPHRQSDENSEDVCIIIWGYSGILWMDSQGSKVNKGYTMEMIDVSQYFHSCGSDYP